MSRAPRTRRRLPWWGWVAIMSAGAAVTALATVLIVSGLHATPPPAPLPASQFNSDPGAVPDPVTGPPPVIGPVTTGSQPRTTVQQAADHPAKQRTRSQAPHGPLADNRLVIPAVGVDAPVGVSGVADGQLILPSNVADTTMWDGSAPIDSDRGTILVAGHVDNVHQGPGAMWPLHLAQPGDAVYLTHNGTVTRWKIVASQAVTKAELPQDVFTGKRGPRLLKLVTCGGQVVHDAAGRGSYVDNVVITAVPF